MYAPMHEILLHVISLKASTGLEMSDLGFFFFSFITEINAHVSSFYVQFFAVDLSSIQGIPGRSYIRSYKRTLVAMPYDYMHRTKPMRKRQSLISYAI